MATHILQTKRTGFTLLELLVVISVIGLLSTILIVNLNLSRASARDAYRIGWLNAYKQALDLYYLDHDKFPGDDTGDWDSNAQDDGFVYGQITQTESCRPLNNGPAYFYSADNSVPAGILEQYLEPNYLKSAQFIDPLRPDSADSPFNCRYVIPRGALEEENVKLYLLHCRMERPSIAAQNDGGDTPLYYEIKGGNEGMCLLGHVND